MVLLTCPGATKTGFVLSQFHYIKVCPRIFLLFLFCSANRAFSATFSCHTACLAVVLRLYCMNITTKTLSHCVMMHLLFWYTQSVQYCRALVNKREDDSFCTIRLCTCSVIYQSKFSYYTRFLVFISVHVVPGNAKFTLFTKTAATNKAKSAAETLTKRQFTEGE